MPPYYFEINVKIEQVVTHADDTCHNDTRDEIVHTKLRYQFGYKCRRHEGGTERRDNKIYVAMVHLSRRTLEDKVPAKPVVTTNGDEEGARYRYIVGNTQHTYGHVQERQIEKKSGDPHYCVSYKPLEAQTHYAILPRI